MNVDNLIATDDVDVVDVPHVPVEQKKMRGGRPLGAKIDQKQPKFYFQRKRDGPLRTCK